MFKYTKIGATIGPSSEDAVILEKMIKAGMNFARLNFAHGTYGWHEKTIKKIREASKKSGESVAILQDLQGPRIRIGELPEKGVKIKAGEEVILDTAISAYEGKSLPVDQRDLHIYLKTGERILIDDGRLELHVSKVEGTMVKTIVTEGGTILSHKGINLPDSRLKIPALSEKDRNDLRFGVKNGVDMVGLSFVSTANDIIDARFLIEQIIKEEKIDQPGKILIIAKIERHEAVENIDEILNIADGIMVARGDLGLELPLEDVPLIQKKIIDQARSLAKPVIVATQLLDSMRESYRPTRAEVSDVANAVIDHADALLLTNETAAGEHPVETVETMAKIILATEKSHYDDTPTPPLQKGISTVKAVSELSRLLAEEVGAKFILAASQTGDTGRLISHVRPNLPIFVATTEEIVLRQLNMSWGVRPFILPYCTTLEEFVVRSIAYVKKGKHAKDGDKMIVLAGEPMNQAGNVNLVEVREIR